MKAGKTEVFSSSKLVRIRKRKFVLPEDSYYRNESEFCLTLSPNGCLIFTTFQTFDRAKDILSQTAQRIPAANALLRFIVGGVEEVTVSKEKTVSVSRFLLEKVNLDNEVLWVERRNFVELWNPGLFASANEYFDVSQFFVDS